METEYADCVDVSMKLYELAFELYEASSLLILGKNKYIKQKGICMTDESLHQPNDNLKEQIL